MRFKWQAFWEAKLVIHIGKVFFSFPLPYPSFSFLPFPFPFLFLFSHTKELILLIVRSYWSWGIIWDFCFRKDSLAALWWMDWKVVKQEQLLKKKKWSCIISAFNILEISYMAWRVGGRYSKRNNLNCRSIQSAILLT